MGPYNPELLDAIERLALSWKGTVWRAVVGSTPVKRTSNLGGRWNTPGVEVLYTSLAENVARAELEHLLSAQPVPVLKERRVHKLRVKLRRVIDLSTESAIDSLGLRLTDIHGPNRTISQNIGGAVAWLQYGGLLVPSARAAGTNLVVFTTTLLPDDVVEPEP
jgi:RES domain-containing protein